jgi:crotonobetaine/carnitine-CoA ligase
MTGACASATAGPARSTPARGARLEPRELFEFFKDTLPYLAIPRYVEVVDALPRNAIGRVIKDRLREARRLGAWDFKELGLTAGRQAGR